MCGIAAIFPRIPETAVAVQAARQSAMQRAMRALHHRGPDRQSLWAAADGRAHLGHARLGLIDLSPAGDQPLASLDGSLHLVQNGEFYGFAALRAELQARGHGFRSGSDAEVLLPLYQESGTAALARLCGEFAFVLWDERNRSVFAARDRFGIKPLFYAVHAGDLYLASEVKALFAMGVPAAWDEASVFQYHQTSLLLPTQTLYRGIRQIPPGHFLLASGDDIASPTLHRYWDFDYAVANDDPPQPASPAVVRTLQAKLEAAVERRLHADVPVACYLSGGIDSSAVLGIAARYSQTPVAAFTLAFADSPAHDESALAAASARAVGAHYHEVPVRSQDLADHFTSALWHAEFPFVNANGVAKFLLSRATKAAGFRAVLTGEGADEIFAGYLHFRKDRLLGRSAAEQQREIERLYQSNPVARAMMLSPPGPTPAALRAVEQTLGFVPTFVAANAYGASFALDLLNPDLRANFAQQDGWRAWLNQLDLPRQVLARPRLHQSLYLWSRSMLPIYLLPILGDRMEMAHGVEGRVPFLDHHLVEHVAALPEHWKIGTDLTEKFLLREAARPFLTDAVYRRQKQPFLAPPAAAAPESALFALLQDTLRSPALLDNAFYDRRAVLQTLERLPQMMPDERSGIDCQLTNILSFVLLGQGLGITA